MLSCDSPAKSWKLPGRLTSEIHFRYPKGEVARIAHQGLDSVHVGLLILLQYMRVDLHLLRAGVGVEILQVSLERVAEDGLLLILEPLANHICPQAGRGLMQRDGLCFAWRGHRGTFCDRLRENSRPLHNFLDLWGLALVWGEAAGARGTRSGSRGSGSGSCYPLVRVSKGLKADGRQLWQRRPCHGAILTHCPCSRWAPQTWLAL
mmetsp:Transcript_2335/g.4908  ORF Transcript_2335/g.4908 Transcript_2335/m.4908 type:complete len:206 (+) Transcript_2335:151-768(+)